MVTVCATTSKLVSRFEEMVSPALIVSVFAAVSIAIGVMFDLANVALVFNEFLACVRGSLTLFVSVVPFHWYVPLFALQPENQLRDLMKLLALH